MAIESEYLNEWESYVEPIIQPFLAQLISDSYNRDKESHSAKDLNILEDVLGRVLFSSSREKSESIRKRISLISLDGSSQIHSYQKQVDSSEGVFESKFAEPISSCHFSFPDSLLSKSKPLTWRDKHVRTVTPDSSQISPSYKKTPNSQLTKSFFSPIQDTIEIDKTLSVMSCATMEEEFSTRKNVIDSQLNCRKSNHLSFSDYPYSENEVIEKNFARDIENSVCSHKISQHIKNVSLNDTICESKANCSRSSIRDLKKSFENVPMIFHVPCDLDTSCECSVNSFVSNQQENNHTSKLKVRNSDFSNLSKILVENEEYSDSRSPPTPTKLIQKVSFSQNSCSISPILGAGLYGYLKSTDTFSGNSTKKDVHFARELSLLENSFSGIILKPTESLKRNPKGHQKDALDDFDLESTYDDEKNEMQIIHCGSIKENYCDAGNLDTTYDDEDSLQSRTSLSCVPYATSLRFCEQAKINAAKESIDGNYSSFVEKNSDEFLLKQNGDSHCKESYKNKITLSKIETSTLNWMISIEKQRGKQVENLNFEIHGGILSHMCLKSYVSIVSALLLSAALQHINEVELPLKKFNYFGNTLIVTSKQKISNWIEVFDSLTLACLQYTDSIVKRRKISIHEICENDVVLTTFDVLKAKEEPPSKAAEPFFGNQIEEKIFKYKAPSTPVSKLHCVRWKRIIVDDAYVLASKSLMNTPSQGPNSLAALHRWCLMDREDACRVNTSVEKLRCLYSFIGIPPNVPMSQAAAHVTKSNTLCT